MKNAVFALSLLLASCGADPAGFPSVSYTDKHTVRLGFDGGVSFSVVVKGYDGPFMVCQRYRGHKTVTNGGEQVHTIRLGEPERIRFSSIETWQSRLAVPHKNPAATQPAIDTLSGKKISHGSILRALKSDGK